MSKRKFYVVFRGHRPGIYYSWPATFDQIEKFEKPYFRKYNTFAEANKALQEYTLQEG